MIELKRIALIRELVNHIKDRPKKQWKDEIIVDLFDALMEANIHESTTPDAPTPIRLHTPPPVAGSNLRAASYSERGTECSLE